jgi:8-oxo-dGTP pyrophosphatase MutT (NUDIX family)
MPDPGLQPQQPLPGQSRLEISLDDARRALALPDFGVVEAQLRMAPQPRPFRRIDAPGTARLASVLVLLYPVDGVLTFVLMLRTEYGGVHSGQISLPGGSREDGETFEQTALRETYEEFGVSGPVELLGALTPIYVPPSDFEIHPFVGYLPSRPDLKPDPGEVAAALEVPLHLLLDPDAKGIEETSRYGQPFTIPFYRVGPHQVWGATAIMLSELEGRLRAVIEVK